MIMKLPEHKIKGKVSVEEAISRRRSVRSFTGERLTDHELSQILWAAQGITDPKTGFRAVPSAGATFPIEVYVVTSEGSYRYTRETHSLEQLKTGNLLEDLARACLDQGWIRKAGAVVVLAGGSDAITSRYGAKGETYVGMEAGHSAQNIHLQAVALGLGSTPVGAFDGETVACVVGMTDGEKPVYLVPVGRPAQK